MKRLSYFPCYILVLWALSNGLGSSCHLFMWTVVNALHYEREVLFENILRYSFFSVLLDPLLYFVCKNSPSPQIWTTFCTSAFVIFSYFSNNLSWLLKQACSFVAAQTTNILPATQEWRFKKKKLNILICLQSLIFPHIYYIIFISL